jgi:peroxiredoxin family protein
LIPKDSKTILAFVDFERIDGKYMPYKSDNVYLLTNYLKEKRDDISIVYIPANQFGGRSGSYLTLKDKSYFFIKRLRAKVILYKQPPHLSEYFTKKQHLICLGYFIPFKADYLDFKEWWVFYSKILNNTFDLDGCIDYGNKVLKHYTYTDTQFKKTNLTYITASRYCSETTARSHNIPTESFKELGSPKSDIVESKKDIDWVKIFNLKKNPKKVIVCTLTFRDIYIYKKNDNVDEIGKTIFGYLNEKELLEDFLVVNSIIIVIKLHKSFPFYRELEKLHIKKDKSYFRNCYFLDFELEAKYDISIYNLFELSDGMITDYSSISFDYLPYDKPIIYNIPDIEEYRDYRGFSYEPIEEMMPGEKVITIGQFKEALLNVSKGEYNYKAQRERVLSIVNEVPQGKALENIYKYVKELID